MSALPAWARDLLRCPACRAALDDHGGALRCVACRRSYPVRDGVPVLLVDQADVEA